MSSKPPKIGVWYRGKYLVIPFATNPTVEIDFSNGVVIVKVDLMKIDRDFAPTTQKKTSPRSRRRHKERG